MKKLALSVSIFLMPLLVCVATDFRDVRLLGWKPDNNPCWADFGLIKKATIDGKEYDQVMVYGLDYSNMKWLTPSPCIFYYRFEEDKVWRYDEEKGEEDLLFDYTLDIGNEFIRPNGERLRVENVEQEDIKTLHLRNVETGEEDVWRQGSGSLKSSYLIDGDLGLRFTDILRREGKYHEKQDTDYLKEFPISSVHTDDAVGLTYTFDGDSLRVQGVITMDSGSKQPIFTWCIFSGRNVYIDFSPSGNDGPDKQGSIYLAVDFKIGGFSPGTYAVHFKNKKSEVVCQGTSTSISDFTVKKNHTSTLYDLQGRRLDHEPQHGVFIRDGQKVMK